MFGTSTIQRTKEIMLKPVGTRETQALTEGVTLSWRDLSVYATDRGSSICKQLINNGMGSIN